MAELDVSELMSDPDFVDPIQVISQTTIVNNLGENILSSTVLNTIGSVQPADFKAVQKIPEALRTSDIRSFFFKGVITASAPGKYSDVLIFKGQRFQVLTVEDWSNFGAGYTEGVCVGEKPS